MALKHVVRQSPDVILIGEMRDVETMNVALQAAETGHLVFSTVHTPAPAKRWTASSTCSRRTTSRRSACGWRPRCAGVVSQKLVPRARRHRPLAAVEVMIATPTVAKLVEEGRFGQPLLRHHRGRLLRPRQDANEVRCDLQAALI